MKIALAVALMLASPLAFAAVGGRLDANFLLLCIAAICWFVAAFPLPAPWGTYHGNLVAIGLFFFGLSLIVA